MIEKIHIESFGSFKDFLWNKNVSSSLGILNVFYGRNYSGKTTLSRIFRSIEQKKLHEDFRDGMFTIELSDKKILKHLQLANTDLKMRVYNSDFKSENLSFLSNKEGQITPFAILGEKNVKTEKEISYKISELEVNRKRLIGNSENPGIRSQVESVDKKLEEMEMSLDKTLRVKAKNIRRDPTLFKIGAKGDYDIRNIKAELSFAQTISSIETTKLRSILSEDEKKPIVKIKPPLYKLDNYLEKSIELLRKSISPNETIEFLIKDTDLQNWVKQGIHHHKDTRDHCAFCDSKLTTYIWEKLNAHFTKEAESHEMAIKKLINEIKAHRVEIQIKEIDGKGKFYVEFQDYYQTLIDNWDEFKKDYLNDLECLLNKLKLRSDNIYNEYSLDKEMLKLSQETFDNCISQINEVIEKNNTYSNTVSEKKNEAIKKLRLNEIKNFKDEINYYDKLEKIQAQKISLEGNKEELNDLENNIKQLELSIAQLRTLLNDELKAKDKVNEYLSVSLEHPELSLEVEKGENKSTFVIKRNGDVAHNLSEGEQTLISFSYFLATLKDIPDRDKDVYTIFIDDPICSLDGSNIFYIFSLIDSEVVQDRYGQVFVSTHNMDFLKYLRRASRKINYFMIERQFNSESKANSRLLDMPKYMRQYVTEFIFLFEQICIVANEVQNDENYHIFYNFPNNARKFLESYLFFKYPNTKIKNEDRIKLFFGKSPQQVAFLQRINNEYSHGEEQFDRLSKPVDIPEFQQDALLILNTVREKDEEQYNAFSDSIKK